MAIAPSVAVAIAPPVSELDETARVEGFDPKELDAQAAALEAPVPPERPERDDTTVVSPPAAHVRARSSGLLASAVGLPVPSLRTEATLPRQRGLVGDMRYVFTVLFGLRRARHEAALVHQTLDRRRKDRLTRLRAIGRAALADLTITSDEERDDIATAEDARARAAAQREACGHEMADLRQGRETRAGAHAAAQKGISDELQQIRQKLEPLERAAASVRKRASTLADSLAGLDRTIADLERQLRDDKLPAPARASGAAELASVRADRVAVSRDEPVLARELADVQPRIAALMAARVDAEQRRTAQADDDRNDASRVAELLTALDAKQRVLERGEQDAEVARDKLLLALGEAAAITRPAGLARELTPLDELDGQIAIHERKAMEYREVITNVSRAAVVRGVAAWVSVAAIAVGILLLIL